ncbi:hypothetical protein VTG60DRAFT_1266 [Thermothelomyces hinnuleus]
MKIPPVQVGEWREDPSFRSHLRSGLDDSAARRPGARLNWRLLVSSEPPFLLPYGQPGIRLPCNPYIKGKHAKGARSSGLGCNRPLSALRGRDSHRRALRSCIGKAITGHPQPTLRRPTGAGASFLADPSPAAGTGCSLLLHSSAS